MRTTEDHAEQLRQHAAMGGNVEITEPGCDEATTKPAALRLAGPPALGAAYYDLMQARARLIAAAALPGSPENVARAAEALATMSVNILARHLSAVEAAGGEIRYRSAA